MKVTVCDVRITRREVEVPGVCPRCSAAGHIWDDAVRVNGKRMPIVIRCAVCGSILAAGTVTEESVHDQG